MRAENSRTGGEPERLPSVHTETLSKVQSVRFVGYGPKDDLWYEEEDLRITAPEMVDAYEEALTGNNKE